MSFERLPLIVVKRCYYDEFLTGVKTVEYRRHKAQFNARVFCPGRRVRIAYNYNLNRHPSLTAIVTRFQVVPASEHPEMLDFYQGLQPNDEIALIHLCVERGASSSSRRPMGGPSIGEPADSACLVTCTRTRGARRKRRGEAGAPSIPR